MARERNGLQEYDRIRGFISNIYLYGFLCREDYEKLGICSAENYDQCTKLLRLTVSNIEGENQRKDRKKQLKINRIYEISNEEKLANTYLLHTISEQELQDLLWIVSTLTSEGSMLSTKLYDYVSSRDESGEASLSRTTFSRRKADLIKYGYCKEHDGKISLYPNLLEILSDEELAQLYYYVCFSSEVTYPRVAGSFLKRNVFREILTRPAMCVPKRFPFLFRRNTCRNIFDEETVYQLREAIDSYLWVQVQHNGQHSVILPISLKIDTRLGRWYLLYWDKQAHITRVSNIRKVKPLYSENAKKWNDNYNEVLDTFSLSGCSGKWKDDESYFIQAQLFFENNQRIYKQFCRDIRMGNVSQENEKKYYSVRINDPNELIPLLRQYSPYLKITPGTHHLDRRIREDLETMKQQLEAIL